MLIWLASFMRTFMHISSIDAAYGFIRSCMPQAEMLRMPFFVHAYLVNSQAAMLRMAFFTALRVHMPTSPAAASERERE
jgi:hypothetical protein